MKVTRTTTLNVSSILICCLYCWHWTLRVMLCALWVPSVQFEKRENSHGGVILLLELQTEASNFAKRDTSPRMFLQMVTNYAKHQIFCCWVSHETHSSQGHQCNIKVKLHKGFLLVFVVSQEILTRILTTKKTPWSKKTAALTKNMNIWVVGISNQLYKRFLYQSKIFLKKILGRFCSLR